MAEKFNLARYLSEVDAAKRSEDAEAAFQGVLELVQDELNREWEQSEDDSKILRLEREKRAIIGCENEVAFYKAKIRSVLTEHRLMASPYPHWYSDLTEAVFAELYGLSGLASWAYDMLPKYRESSSAKLIGSRMYCLIDGKSELQPQRIPDDRREKLKRTLLLATPEERYEYGFHEVYLKNGIRVTIYSGSRTKKGQDVIVMRKYLLKERLEFTALEELDTIPEGSSELFKRMVGLGFNVMFTGPVRSGKTTLLQTWQQYEDPTLEGLAVATDPETPWHEMMPDAPIMQLIGEGEQLNALVKSILRVDNDYVLLEEMRDAASFRMFMDILSTGTMRSKATIHDRDALGAAFKIASKIREAYGGDQDALIAQVYANVDYVFVCEQDEKNRAHKLVKEIWELSYDGASDRVKAMEICRFDERCGDWLWRARVSRPVAERVNCKMDELEEMMRVMKQLERKHRLEDAREIIPAYYLGNRKRNPGSGSPAAPEFPEQAWIASVCDNRQNGYVTWNG